MTTCRTPRAIVVLAAGIWLLISIGNPATLDAQAAMIRSLLAERFTLRVHVEERELPIYALAMALRKSRRALR